MPDEKKLICCKCQKELKPEKTNFSYLGHSFYTDALKCPGCGEVFIPEDMARGRIADVEMQLEDK
jgi:hypothetical protein